MLKRVTFYVIIAAIPAVVGSILLYYGYGILRRAAERVDYHPVLTQQQSAFAAELTRFITDANRDSPTPVIDGDIAEYVANWVPVLSWVVMPGVTGNLNPNVRGKFVNTNDLGYRGTVNFKEQIAQAKRQKAQGKRIAVFVGGSVGFGLYSKDDRTDIVGYMNSEASERGSNIVFYNFAMGSYTSAEELNALVTFAHMLNPDILIIFHGYNDALRLTDDGVYAMGVGVPFTFLGVRQIFPRVFKSEWLDRKYDASSVSAVDEAEFFDHYTKNVRLMHRIMKAFGGTTVLATQPFKQFRNGCYRIAEASERTHIVNLQRFYPKLIAIARAVAVDEGISYLDLSAAFEDERCRGAYVDGAHMSSVGQRIIAQQLHEAAIVAARSLEILSHR